MPNQIHFSGVLDADTGPSIVNRAYTSRCQDWLIAETAGPGFRNVLSFIRRRRQVAGVLVSSTSGYHVVLLLLARVLGKDGYYLAHGVGSLERRINDTPSLRAAVVERLTVRSASTVVAVSHSLAAQLVKVLAVPAAKVQVVLNGVDSAFAATATIPEAPMGLVRIMTVGSRPIKNIETLCRAVERASVREIEFVVIGDLPNQTLPQRAGLHVLNYKRLSHADTMAWMRSSHVFVQISAVEPFGLAVCEAAQLGCSLLLSTVVGAIPVLTNLDAGNLVVCPTDVDEVSEKLEALVEAVRLGRTPTHACIRTWQDAAVDLGAVMTR